MEKNAKHPGGRPRKTIDYVVAEKLGRMMCTVKEIAAYLNVSVSLLEHDEQFMQVYKKGLESGKMSLRRMQYRAAEGGNVAMLIWLGKQYLEQREPKHDVTVEHSGKVDSKLAALSVEQLIRLAGEDDGNAEG